MDQTRYRIEDLFAELNIVCTKQGRRYVGRCPVHGGDSYDSFNFYPDGTNGKAFWNCHSNECERKFTGNIIGFVRGVLSHTEFLWEQPGDQEATWQDAIDYLCQFLKTTWRDLKPDLKLAEINKFVASVEAFGIRNVKQDGCGICNRQRVRKLLEIPSQYYIERGFSPEILDQYDVGLCRHPSSELYGRVVIPIYYNDANRVAGCIGRTTNPECPECKTHHHSNTLCYTEGENIKNYAKVLTSKRFNDKNFLYNYWYAKEDIYALRHVVVVEGCADVWRLVESGITNVVGINGSAISDPQLISLESSGATEILCLTDNDESGERAYEQIVKRCWFADVKRPVYDGKDIGDMEINKLKNYDFHKELKERLKNAKSDNHRI